MKICVAGLGLIGGSMCMSLKRAGYAVDGWNRSEKPLAYALERGIIDGAAENFTGYDVVFVALPPEATIDFINATSFKTGAIVADICGVKRWIEEEVNKLTRTFRYVGCHPMAGKEVSSVFNATETLFDSASMVISLAENTDADALETIRELTKAMGFARIVECSAEVHDRKIAYTSQLAHVLSNAYVKDCDLDGCLGFTGGSFQDMTRIAGVDENVWASLYLRNAENLSEKISSLVSSLEEIRKAVESGDKTALTQVLRRGRKLFEADKEKSYKNQKVSVKYLK